MSNRRHRIIISDTTAVYHLICRTACQAYLFGDAEKEMFARLLFHQARFAGIEILSYCIMSNHVHLLARISPIDTLPDETLLKRYRDYYGVEKVPQSTYSVNELEAILAGGGPEAEAARQRILARMGDLSSFMRELKQRFTIWYNHKHENQGTIWASRYKSLIVENAAESLTRVAAYIDLNPVRAEIVTDPKDYRWCGYAAAMEGFSQQRRAISHLFLEESNYGECIQSYRLILFGKGHTSKGSNEKDRGRIAPEALTQLLKSEAPIAPEALYKTRVRYFTDGTAIGSKDFLDGFFLENRSAFGSRRKRAGSALPHQLWGQLHVIRDLKKNVYG